MLDSTIAFELEAPKPSGANPKAPYYPGLDGLRAVAVLLVFSAHYAGFPLGWTGVNIFFVLSGFLITGILYDGQNAAHRFRNFYVRRTLRIFPLFYAVWISLALATPLIHIAWNPLNLLWPAYLGNWIPLYLALGGQAGIMPLHLVAHSLRAGHHAVVPIFIGHFWSLCIEEQFYLLWPIVVFTVRSREKLLWICAAGVVFCPILRIVLMNLLPHNFADLGVLHNCTFLRLDEFLWGGAAVLALRVEHWKQVRVLALKLLSFGVIGICGSYLIGHFLMHSPDILVTMPWILSTGITLADIVGLSLILFCVDSHGWFPKVMNNAPLRALGRVSYGFYVFHDIPHAMYDRASAFLNLNHPGLHLVVPFVGTLALSFASYSIIELPFLRMKRHFEGKVSSAPSKAALQDAAAL